MKPADISEGKNRKYLKDKVNELAKNSKNKSVRDLNRGIDGFKMASRWPSFRYEGFQVWTSDCAVLSLYICSVDINTIGLCL
jgi:hypothetical protein